MFITRSAVKGRGRQSAVRGYEKESFLSLQGEGTAGTDFHGKVTYKLKLEW